MALPTCLKKVMLKYYEVGEKDECWLWLGGISGNGYGAVCENRRVLLAHRVQYTISIGPIPGGMLVLHSCDNRACVNPNHLRLGTHKENMRDRRVRSRTAIGSRTGNNKLIEEEVKEILTSSESNVVLAAKYGVHHKSIARLRRGVGWQHVREGGTV